jgi:hypothetical protein
MGRARTVSVVALVASLIAAGAVPVAGQSSDPAHEVRIETPSQVTVGENEIRVVVDNSNAQEDLFSPLVEVPLRSSLSASSPDPRVEFGGTSEDRTYAVQNSSYRAGDSLFVYGENVPAGETRTYVFTLEVDEAGNRTIEADVRPLYNEPNNARTSVSVDAQATGTLDVRVRDGSTGTSISGASVTVDGSARTGGDVSVSVPDGQHSVTASGAGTDFPTLSPSVSTFATRRVTFTHYDSLADPRVIANATRAEIVDGSAETTVIDPGSASNKREYEVSFLLDVDDGTVVVGVADPSAVSPSKSRDVTVSGGTLAGTDRVDDTTRLTVEGDGLVDVTVAYTGYSSGDATRDGTVDAADAQAAAQAAADQSVTNGYGDIDGDGQVTAVDAMFIQQYADGNRTVDYGSTGGGN